ncbi:MAG TPA: trehalose-phosphatase [Gaiellaceae bacterium]|jgi:trehalose 6-phosphate phosphatase|nr:trehalose-phosphatase [Gaiellaceae bacterium]
MPLPPPLAELARDPRRAAILLDVDGTLAPIVADPDASTVPEETRAELRRLAGRYALVACLTGRTAIRAREIVGVEELEYVGEHGLELVPEAEEWLPVLDRFSADARWPVERKRLTLGFHYRTAEDEEAALAVLRGIAAAGEEAGLVARWGRKVLELRPPIDATKGTGVVHLLERRGIDRALFAGDDLTDLDGFRAMERLPLGVKVAVASAEGPPELRERADVVVEGPDELRELLRQL